MRKIVLAGLLALGPGVAGAAETVETMDAQVDVTDTASLQRGAKLFVNYCMGCHSLKYLRYGRMASDLEIPEEVLEQDLIWGESEVHETMTNSMPAAPAEQWFGVAPPDLTLTARSRGADWVYTYLNTFYRDESQPTGVNNVVLEGSAMPHVLWRLQGMPQPVHGGHGEGEGPVTGVEVAQDAGTMSEEEYQRATRDITNFLVYAAEPIKAYRQSVGVWVILFLLVFLVLAYLLKKEYWKDLH